LLMARLHSSTSTACNMQARPPYGERLVRELF
jgi:hypothetical protein